MCKRGVYRNDGWMFLNKRPTCLGTLNIYLFLNFKKLQLIFTRLTQQRKSCSVRVQYMSTQTNPNFTKKLVKTSICVSRLLQQIVGLMFYGQWSIRVKHKSSDHNSSSVSQLQTQNLLSPQPPEPATSWARNILSPQRPEPEDTAADTAKTNQSNPIATHLVFDYRWGKPSLNNDPPKPVYFKIDGLWIH